MVGNANLILPDCRQAVRRTLMRQANNVDQDSGMKSQVGILVHGNNHFIVRGPVPDRAAALALVRYWTLIQIGAATPNDLKHWRISSREFRENLEWAVVVPGDGELSPAVALLLEELSARGINIHNLSG